MESQQGQQPRNKQKGQQAGRIMKMSTKLYVDFIKQTIKTEGIKIADTANKLALESKQITVEQYSKAAQLIVKAYLAQ